MERERNVSGTAQVRMKPQLVICRHHQVVRILCTPQGAMAMRKVPTVIKVTQPESSVIAGNHQPQSRWFSGLTVTPVANRPTPTVPWGAIQLHVTSFVCPAPSSEFFLVSLTYYCVLRVGDIKRRVHIIATLNKHTIAAFVAKHSALVVQVIAHL